MIKNNPKSSQLKLSEIIENSYALKGQRLENKEELGIDIKIINFFDFKQK